MISDSDNNPMRVTQVDDTYNNLIEDTGEYTELTSNESVIVSSTIRLTEQEFASIELASNPIESISTLLNKWGFPELILKFNGMY